MGGDASGCFTEAIERDWMLQDYLRIELPPALSEGSRIGDNASPYARVACDDAVLERMSGS